MKNTLKNILFSLGIIGILGLGNIGLVNATGDNTFGKPGHQGTYSWDWDEDTKQELDVASKDNTYNSNGLVPTIKTFINRVLGMLSLIALVICLRGGFQMLTASGDEGKYKKGFTILKQAAIALAVIGLAWLFVTLILYLINNSAYQTPTS